MIPEQKFDTQNTSQNDKVAEYLRSRAELSAYLVFYVFTIEALPAITSSGTWKSIEFVDCDTPNYYV